MTFGCTTSTCADDGRVQLMKSSFDGCDLTAIEAVDAFDGWKMQNGYAVANSCNEGALTFDPIDGDAYASVTIDLTMATGNICNFEGSGDLKDTVTIQYWDGSGWVTLDTFTRVGDRMVGDQTGQTFSGNCWSTLSYTVDEPNEGLQFRVVTDVTAEDELVAVSEVCITAAPKPVCEPVVTTFMHEDFAGICDPAQSGDVAWDDGWDVHHGSAYADGCNDGALVFSPIDAGGQDSVTFSFDIAAGNLGAWESWGDGKDYVAVYVTQNGCWELLEVFIRDGDKVRGQHTGQTFNAQRWTTVSFTVDTPEDGMSFAVVANLTAQNEYVWLDDAKIEGTAMVPCDPSPALEYGSIGDVVWLDADADGVQDAAETGVAGVTVELYKDGVATGRTAVTDASGAYLFDELEAGAYAIRVTGVPEGYRLTVQNAGGDDLADSDVDASTGLSDAYSLAAGEHYRGLDAGITLIPLGALGDRIWFDADGDGVQDEGETGVAGVTVALLKDGIATGDTVVTDADGAYLFDGLEAGSYSIAVTGLAEGYEFTAAGQGTEATDSDVDAGGLSSSVILAEGEDHFDLDAGIRGIAPTLADDAVGTCADETMVIDVLANDGAGLTITEIDGQAISAGGSVAIASGATLTLNADGTLTYDGIAAWADVLVGMSDQDAFSYTATTVQGGFAAAQVDVRICGAGANVASDFIPTLPETVEITMASRSGGFSITATSEENANLNVAGSPAVWCVDQHGDAASLIGVASAANVFLADENDASLGAYVVHYENLDLVNYILNQDYATTLGARNFEIQYAIWSLTDGDGTGTAYSSVANIAAIIDDAKANGEGFVAEEGDLVGLLLAPVQGAHDDGEPTNYQNFIYGVEWSQLDDCLCC